MSSRSLVYVSYDRVPAPKGAATHIQAFVAALAQEYEPLDLVTVAGPPLAGTPPAGSAPHALPTNVQHHELAAHGDSLIERVLNFRTQLRVWWGDRRPAVAHVRSIYEGYPIACNKPRWCERLVYEVNGLPSIELKYHYPAVTDDRELWQKLVAQEQRCLAAADLVITVSQVNAAYLRLRGVPANRLHVIPNGVDLEVFHYRRPEPSVGRELSLLYSGTLSAWQGVQTAIEALALYRRDAPARLTIAGEGRPRQQRALRELADRLRVGEFVQLVGGVDRYELARLHHAADVIVAPLVPNDRNLVQGCCPLKVLEAMASGTPLVASDLPVVSALARPEIDALLVAPGSAKAIKDGLLRLANAAELAERLSLSARQRVEEHFTWQLAQDRLLAAYRTLNL